MDASIEFNSNAEKSYDSSLAHDCAKTAHVARSLILDLVRDMRVKRKIFHSTRHNTFSPSAAVAYHRNVHKLRVGDVEEANRTVDGQM